MCVCVCDVRYSCVVKERFFFCHVLVRSFVTSVCSLQLSVQFFFRVICRGNGRVRREEEITVGYSEIGQPRYSAR